MRRSFCCPDRGAEAGIGAWHLGNRQQNVPAAAFFYNGLRTVVDGAGFGAGNKTATRSRSVAWSESFLYAGITALLLLLASQFAQWWFLSLIALTPFLYRITRASLLESVRLGFLLGAAFLTVSLANHFILNPGPAFIKLLCGICLFTLFSWVLCRARTVFGFNPIVTALIWVGFELAVIELGFSRGLFGEGELSNSHLNSLVVLFGFIIVSFIIVLFNSLLVIAVEKAVSLGKARETASCEDGRIWDLYHAPGLFAQKCYLVPDVRGPPVA